MRRSVFASNLQLIEERNAAQVAAGYSAVHGVTRFSDLTQAEFRAFSQSFSKRNGGRSAADEAAHYMVRVLECVERLRPRNVAFC